MFTYWVQFCDTVLTTGKEFLDPSVVQQLESLLLPLKTSPVPNHYEDSIRSYFTDCPAHLAAINTLDHSQFVNPLVLGDHTVHLSEILDAFSSKGPKAFGAIWLALLELAHHANPSGFDISQGKAYISDRMNSIVVSAGSSNNIARSAPPLDGMIQTLLSSFPGLQDCMGQILTYTTTNQSNPDQFDGLLHQVQGSILKPLMEGMAQNGSPVPDLQPAISQIFDGFRGLNAALSPSNDSMQ